MALYDNTHKPTPELRQRISDLAIAGIPVYMIAKVVKLDDETITKHYDYELSCSEPEALERVAKTVVMQAINGSEKSQALYLKTKGAKYGWVEKQVIETNVADETKELKDKIKELEASHQQDY